MASGVAVIGAVFYARLGPLGATRASSVPAMEAAMAVGAVIVLAAAALTTLLPRRPGGQAAAGRPAPGPAREEATVAYSTGAPR